MLLMEKSHVTFERVLSYMDESRQTWMSHIWTIHVHMNESYHIWMSHVNHNLFMSHLDTSRHLWTRSVANDAWIVWHVHMSHDIFRSHGTIICVWERESKCARPTQFKTHGYIHAYIYLMFMHTRILSSSHICIYMHIHTLSAFSSFYTRIHHHHVLPFCDNNFFFSPIVRV